MWSIKLFVKWNEKKFSLGIEKLDDQNKNLLSIANDLHDLQGSNSYQAEAITIIQRLYDYTDNQFSYEEGLFREFCYPNIDEHKREHQNFKHEIKIALNDAKRDVYYPINKLLELLKGWIRSHILGVDQLYAEFFKHCKRQKDSFFFESLLI